MRRLLCALAAPVLVLATSCASATGGSAGVAATGDTAAGAAAATVTVTATVEVTVTQQVDHTVTRTVGTGTDEDAKVFDEQKVAAGVEQILTAAPPNGYGLTGVTDVQCPPDEPVKAGRTFECTMKIDGQARSVTVTVKDDAGTYEVGVPQEK